MRFILVSIFFLVTFSGFSQFDSNNKSIGVTPINNDPKLLPKDATKKSNPITNVTPNFKDVPLVKDSEIIFKKIDASKPIDLTQKNDFIKPGQNYKDKLNKVGDGEVFQDFRKNQNLGDFKTKATFLKILCRDNQAVDGDRVRIYINDLVIQENIYLDSNFKEFEITLKPGFNKIDIEALNQGSSGPNTAEFRVFDDKGVLISANQWNLSTGFKATLVMVKD